MNKSVGQMLEEMRNKPFKPSFVTVLDAAFLSPNGSVLGSEGFNMEAFAQWVTEWKKPLTCNALNQ